VNGFRARTIGGVDEVNPFAPPQAASISAVWEERDDARLNRARAALARHLADAQAVAADRRGRRSVDRQTSVVWGVCALWVPEAAVLVAFGVRWPLLVGVLLIYGLIAAMVTGIINPLHWRRTTDPVFAARQWLRGLSQDLPGLALASVAPSARGRIRLPEFPWVGAAGGRELPVGDVAGMHGWIARALAPWWMIGNLAPQRLTLVHRSADLALVACDIEAAHCPRWTGVSLIVGNLATLLALGPLLVWCGPAPHQEGTPVQVACLLGVAAVAVLTAVMPLVVRRATRTRCRMVISKRLLRGEDGLWYLLDGALADDAEAGGSGGAGEAEA
jgi:hypothetical protein